jgi:hypothetical protein
MPNTFTLSGTLKLKPQWVEAFGVTEVTDSASINHTAALVDGTGSGAANIFWKDQVVAPAGGSVAIDLRALSHKAFGGTGALAFAAVKMLVVQSTAPVSFGAADAQRWPGFAAGGVVVDAGGILYGLAPAAGWPVSAGASVVVISNAGAGPATVELYLAGIA